MACGGEFGLDRDATLQRLLERGLEPGLAFFAAGELRIEILPARFELAHLRVEARETRQQGLMTGAARFDADRGLAGRSSRSLRRFAGRDQAATQDFALGFERDAALFEFAHRIDGFLEATTRGTAAGVGGFERALDFRHLERELLHALAALFGAGAQAVDLRAQAHVARATARHHCLMARQAIFEVAHAAAQRLEVGLGGAVLRLLRIERGTFGSQAFFAFDDALVGILVAADAQPVRADPDAVARDDRLARAQFGPQAQRIVQGIGGNDAFEQCVETRRTAYARAQRSLGVTGGGRALGPGEKRDGAGRKALERAGHVVQ